MNDVQLDKIDSYLYKDIVIIPIRKEIIKLIGTDKIQFQSAIKDGKFVLLGPVVQGPTTLTKASLNTEVN